MTPRLSTGLRVGAACLIAAAWQLGASPAAWAQQPPPLAAPPPAAEPPASTAMSTPPLTGPLVANPNPMKFDAGPLNTVYLTGTVSGLGMFQTAPLLGDHGGNVDMTNGLVALQNTEGVLQFFVMAGAYSFPALGAPYFHADKTMSDLFGPLPEGYIKIAPNDAFSVQVGKLPTLIGAEYAFTFQNMNIERGLLWNQEPIVSRGVQVNYTMGPLALSGSLNDGFYSDSYNWVTGSAAWTINKENTLTFVGGGNFDHTDKNLFTCVLAGCPVASAILAKTPWFQNNGSIFNAIYTYNAAPWTITPYFQYTNVPGNAFLGAPKGASTYGGAFLANYSFSDNWNVAGRWEYIASSGNAANGNVSLLYGPGSEAFSFTLTPTYQLGIGFLRGEASVVKAFGITPGFGFAHNGLERTQGRFLVEAGVIF
jgi:putative OmpL-like beta-barrel porin-2